MSFALRLARLLWLLHLLDIATAAGNDLKRIAVSCGASVVLGILELDNSRNSTKLERCRKVVPSRCQSSCDGENDMSSGCLVCLYWRIDYYSDEEITPWLWAPFLVSACERLGFGSAQSFVDTFESDKELYMLAQESIGFSTDPTVVGGGGGGAGIEMWCFDHRFVSFQLSLLAKLT